MQTLCKNRVKPFTTYRKLGVMLLGCICAAGIARAAAPKSYTFTEIVNFSPVQILPNGTILGHSLNMVLIPAGLQVYVPQIYDIGTGSVTNIDVLANGDTLIAAFAANGKGQVLGNSVNARTAPANRANVVVRNADGTLIDLGLFNASNGNSFGKKINDSGQIMGQAGFSSLCTYRTYVGNVTGGGFTDLGTLGGGTFDFTQGYDLNANGQVVGMSSLYAACLASDTFHAFISTPTGLKDLHAASMPAVQVGGSAAVAVNDNGLAAGYYPFAFVPGTRGLRAAQHAVIWDTVANTYADLGKPNFESSLSDINASGQAVGWEGAMGSFAHYAVVGDMGGGTLTPLSTLVTNLPAGWSLDSAVDISDADEILVVTKGATGFVNGYGILIPSAPPTPSVPLSPSGLRVNAVSSSQIDLAWTDNANNESGQMVERCLGVACANFAPIITLAPNVTRYSDTGLAPGTAYSYRVMAQGSAGNSGYSNTATVTTVVVTPTTAPAAPSALNAAKISRRSVALIWVDNSNNESKFQIERCNGINCTNFNKIASVSANSIAFTDAGVYPNSDYFYRIRATNSTGKSAYSNTIIVKTLP
jgi:hypothetical protein